MKKFNLVLLCLVLTGLLYSQKEKLSVGYRYNATLQAWYQFAKMGDWESADKLAVRLDSADTLKYRQLHHPEELKKIINSLILAPKKSVEDWLELARIQSILGKKDDALASLSKAYELDPIREDISRLYFQRIR